MVYIIAQLRKQLANLKQVIGKIVKKFEETAVVTNIERAVHHRFARERKLPRNIFFKFGFVGDV